VGNVAEIVSWCETSGMTRVSADDYDRMRLELGVPDGSRDLIVDKSTILPFGFEQLHGVDFHKGCYVGQEVTARTKHIGQVRKMLYKVRAQNGTLPASGTAIMVGAETAGALCSHAGDIGLALMTLELMEKAKAAHGEFRAGDVPVTIESPKWAQEFTQ
jgi:folate-binding protein YgfZ